MWWTLYPLLFSFFWQVSLTHVYGYFFLCLALSYSRTISFKFSNFFLSCVWMNSTYILFYIGFALFVEKHESGFSPDRNVWCPSRWPSHHHSINLPKWKHQQQQQRQQHMLIISAWYDFLNKKRQISKKTHNGNKFILIFKNSGWHMTSNNSYLKVLPSNVLSISLCTSFGLLFGSFGAKLTWKKLQMKIKINCTEGWIKIDWIQQQRWIE